MRHVTDNDNHTTARSAALTHAATATAHDQRVALLVVNVAAVASFRITSFSASSSVPAASRTTERLLRGVTRRDTATTGTALHIRPIKNAYNTRGIDNAIDSDFARAQEDGASFHLRFGFEED